jgi:hypothetical protein
MRYVYTIRSCCSSYSVFRRPRHSACISRPS